MEILIILFYDTFKSKVPILNFLGTVTRRNTNNKYLSKIKMIFQFYNERINNKKKLNKIENDTPNNVASLLRKRIFFFAFVLVHFANEYYSIPRKTSLRRHKYTYVNVYIRRCTTQT